MVSYALFCPSRGEAYRLPAWLALSSVCAKEGGWRAAVAAAAFGSRRRNEDVHVGRDTREAG